MRKRRHRERGWKEYVFGLIMIAAIGLSAYYACWDRYDDEFDPPQTADLAFSRIGYGFRSLVGAVEGQIEETNESMQRTVDGRHDRNDSRIERDTQQR